MVFRKKVFVMGACGKVIHGKAITTSSNYTAKGCEHHEHKQNTGSTDMRNENNSVGEHHLERELDGANNMMCFLVDDIEISHYLMSYINNKGNMEDWQESLCINAAFVIDELRSEVKRLRSLNTD